MQISVEDLAKTYNRERIWHDVNFTFTSGKYVIEGGNGSGKSTLLRCLSGLETANKGRIQWEYESTPITPENIYKHAAIAAPSIGFYDEFTLAELFDFISRFKGFKISSAQSFCDCVGIPNKKIRGKAIASYSSGMRQRVRLACTVLQKVPFIFLDEPISNLDATGIKWYYNLIEQYISNEILVVASNQVSREAPFCSPSINLIKD